MNPANTSAAELPEHSRAYRLRRFFNWFPMGLTYAFLYMGRYNLTVSKNSLGSLMTKEDFGTIFAVGTWVYGLAFLLNGPLTDRMGGRRALLVAALGAALANGAMGVFIFQMLQASDPGAIDLRLWFSLLYAVNMYFQSFGAVAIVKVNAHWFHVRERGGFSGIFGTMISSGIFFAFTVNGQILDASRTAAGYERTWWVFFAPALLLFSMFLLELFILKDRPGQAGHRDFDTGDASSGEEGKSFTSLQLLRRILTNPIILTVALIEFCTGVLRNGVMHWFPIYAKEIWALPAGHFLRHGSWDRAGGFWVVAALFAVAALFFWLSSRASGKQRARLVISGALLALAPFFLGAGWGGLLFVAGVVGGNVAGWSSDLFFQSRRGPSAACFYLLVGLGVAGMHFTLTLSPLFLGLLVFLISLGVIGTHGLLSGTATMDFGGRKGAATAVGLIDGFVYLGTGLQSLCLGYLTARDWSWWPLFLLPFAAIGFALCLRIWNARPGATRRKR